MGYLACVTYHGSFPHSISIVGVGIAVFNNNGQILDDACPCGRILALMVVGADNEPTVGICSDRILLRITLLCTVFVICLTIDRHLDLVRTRTVLVVIVIPDLLNGEVDGLDTGILFGAGIRYKAVVVRVNDRFRRCSE